MKNGLIATAATLGILAAFPIAQGKPFEADIDRFIESADSGKYDKTERVNISYDNVPFFKTILDVTRNFEQVENGLQDEEALLQLVEQLISYRWIINDQLEIFTSVAESDISEDRSTTIGFNDTAFTDEVYKGVVIQFYNDLRQNDHNDRLTISVKKPGTMIGSGSHIYIDISQDKVRIVYTNWNLKEEMNVLNFSYDNGEFTSTHERFHVPR